MDCFHHSCAEDLSHMSGVPAGLQQQGEAWSDFSLSFLPWPASELLTWLLPKGTKQQDGGKAPRPPKSIALIISEAPRSAAFIQSLAECIMWMAQSGLGHISVYDPQGATAWQCHASAVVECFMWPPKSTCGVSFYAAPERTGYRYRSYPV